LIGICRSDIKEVLGNRQMRKDFGHEIVGIVEWASVSVPLSRGDLVGFDPHVHISRTSGFGELVLAEGDSTNLQRAFPKVKGSISLRKLVFWEPMACAQHCVSNLLRYKGVSRLDDVRIGVVGAGNAGTLIGLLLKHLGATITAFNRSQSRLELLKERQIFSETELRRLGENDLDLFDVIIPATDFLYSSVLGFSIHALRPNGLLLLFGGTRKDDVLPNTSLLIDRVRRHEDLLNIVCEDKPLQIGGTYGALGDDFSKVIDLLSDFPAYFPVEHLVTQEIFLSDLPEMLKAFAYGRREYRGKIVVRPKRLL
jgi:threonine dehydrogenase-like Zn-dependent dehydrogenase